MKICKKIVFFALTLIIITGTLCPANLNVYADNNYEILSKKSGTLDEGESKTFSFTVPVESKVTIKFLGYDDYHNKTYGNYYLEIVDSNEIVKFKKDGTNSFDDENISVNLKKGDYKLKLKENGVFEFDYCFYIVGSPMVDVKAQVNFNKNKIVFKKGEKETLKATIYPEYLSGEIKWSTSDENVATVNNKGQVTAKNLGTAKITAKKDNISGSCEVTVNKIDTKTITNKKSVAFLEYVKYVKNIDNAKWSSSNTKIATVNNKGMVTAKSIGKCNIICKVGKLNYTMPVCVCADYNYEILSKKSGTLDENKSKTFSFTVPVESKVTIKFLGYDNYIGLYGSYYLEIIDSNKTVKFKKEGYASFDDENVSANLKKGDYKLKLKENGDFELDYCFYIVGSPTVEVKPKSVKLNKSKLNLEKGKNEKLKVTISPEYLSREIKWSTNNKNVATVSNKGLVTPKNLGIAKITATKDKKNASCEVTVNKTGIRKIIYKKSTSFLKYVKYIKNNKNAKWSSSNTKIATVNNKGTVTGKNTGKCNIICKVGKQTYTIPIKVVPLVTATPGAVEDSIIYNDAWVVFTNNSSKNITYVIFDVKQYDNRGLKLKSPFNEYYINDTISANSTNSFKSWVHSDTKSIKVRIKKVWFSDGSIWKP